jgi:pyruvate kinase
MARIAHYTEEHFGVRAPTRLRAATRATDNRTAAGQGSQVARSLARVANTVCEELGCKLIVAFTESGSTARLVSSYGRGPPSPPSPRTTIPTGACPFGGAWYR